MPVTGAEVVTRARGAVGHHVIYELGCGGMHPENATPADANNKCDCSGFAMWALGLSRFQPPTWYGTDQIVEDAHGEGKLFKALPFELADLGDLVVYPHPGAGHHGHVGVVSMVDSHGPSSAVHCSLGNWKAFGDAIMETGSQVFFIQPGTIIARLKALELDGASA